MEITKEEIDRLSNLVHDAIKSVTKTAIVTEANAESIKLLAEVMKEEDRETAKIIDQLKEERSHCKSQMSELRQTLEFGFTAKKNRLDNMDDAIAIIKKEMKEDYVSKDQFTPVKEMTRRTFYTAIALGISIIAWSLKFIFDMAITNQTQG